jgi:hypothetical protein
VQPPVAPAVTTPLPPGQAKKQDGKHKGGDNQGGGEGGD